MLPCVVNDDGAQVLSHSWAQMVQLIFLLFHRSVTLQSNRTREAKCSPVDCDDGFWWEKNLPRSTRYVLHCLHVLCPAHVAAGTSCQMVLSGADQVRMWSLRHKESDRSTWRPVLKLGSQNSRYRRLWMFQYVAPWLVPQIRKRHTNPCQRERCFLVFAISTNRWLFEDVYVAHASVHETCWTSRLQCPSGEGALGAQVYFGHL